MQSKICLKKIIYKLTLIISKYLINKCATNFLLAYSQEVGNHYIKEILPYYLMVLIWRNTLMWILIK